MQWRTVEYILNYKVETTIKKSDGIRFYRV